MENNKENQERIRALERYTQEKSKGAASTEAIAAANPEQAPVNVRVPDEVLDQQGYETYMDGKGQVMLRKRQPQQQSLSSRDVGKGKNKIDIGVKDPKALEDLVQQVMRDLPRHGLRAGDERAGETEEALKKLDRGFDGSGGSKG
tara:strand:+ start:9103 stop:9537 length:435 start_codon:yes stop_codon:yes gene_type:complete